MTANDETPVFTSLRHQIRSIIRSDIISGQLEAGRIYPISQLTPRFGTSVTPIREALLDLSNAGLVEAVRNRGFRVIELSGEALQELMEIRLLLEVPTVRRLAGAMSVEEIRTARELAGDTVAAALQGDMWKFLIADRTFHEYLLSRGGNQRLAELVVSLRDQTRLFGLNRMARESKLVDAAQEHLDVVMAIAAGDEDATAEQIKRHVTHVRGAWAGIDELDAR